MALCNKYVALSSVETCEHAGEAGEEGRGHPRRPPAVCTQQERWGGGPRASAPDRPLSALTRRRPTVLSVSLFSTLRPF